MSPGNLFPGRLGLASARIPQVDRHGLMWLFRGKLYVEDGTLHFQTTGFEELPPGDYTIPFQMVSCLLIGPGTTVSHDALRLLAHHGTGLAAVGEDGVRFYASMPFGPDNSARARRQVHLWSGKESRTEVARRMYAWRFGEEVLEAEISVLRGIEGARAKKSYEIIARQYGLTWRGRRYDRSNPEESDAANQAINHAASAVQAVAMLAVSVSGTIPQLGFIHEDSGVAFALDIADLFRDSITLPIAFDAVRKNRQREGETLERTVRYTAGKTFRQQKVASSMIDRIKELIDADDGGGDP